ncbi:hypothetical protein ACIBQ6_22285 [Nonomuraea sp. NPDC049655]|uniref:hypothetical protein n=1 Tax=Nonomuraea sp. NPDC049655 TaxID=3364355 RepID=UPI00379964CD
MADHELPVDLIEAQRAFYRAEERCAELVAAEPSPVAVAALEAELSDEQRQALAAAREERLQIVERIHRHPFWKDVEAGDRIKVQARLREAARA